MHGNVYTLLFVLLVPVLVTACTSIHRMALSKPDAALENINKESIVLMNIRTVNVHKPHYQLVVRSVVVSQNGEEQTFISLGEKGFSSLEGEVRQHLVSFGLAPGKYQLDSIRGSSQLTKIFVGYFSIPVAREFEIKPGSVVYLGRIDAVVRKRRSNDEPKIGSSVPVLGSAVTGFSNATVDIHIRDEYVKDTALFQEKYPSLRTLSIENGALL